MERDLIMKHNYKLVSTLLATTLVAPVLTNIAHADTFVDISTDTELIEAIKNAEDGDVIKLAKPRHLDPNYIKGYLGTITEGKAGTKELILSKNITVDLNGNELLFRGIDIVNRGTLVIENGTIGLIGEIQNPDRKSTRLNSSHANISY